MLRDNLIEVLHEMEEVTKLFKLEPFDIYIIGGSACILGEYTTRATLDIDFVDLGYPAKYGKVFSLLRDYDMLEYQSTILSPSYKSRAKKLKEFEYINVYILSKEDIAVSKIIRLAKKDLEDLNEIIPNCNKQILNEIIKEILEREDLFDSKKQGFINNLKRNTMYRIFCESYDNFLKSIEEDSYRVKITEPFELITDLKKLNEEKDKKSNIYKKLCDLIFYIQQKENIEKYPRLKAFLWTLSSRNIEGQKYNIASKEELEEQTKLINSFLKLAYWY